MSSFKGKTIAISGGASGLGLSTAHLLASRGANLSLADVNATALETAKADLEREYAGIKVAVHVTDVRNGKQVESWIEATVTQFGGLDGAANMAGVVGKGFLNEKGSITNVEDEDWEFVMGVNVTGMMYCHRAQLKHMKRGASIVNASSLAGVRGSPMNVPYCTSKHAVIGLTRSAARDMGPKGIRINAVAP